MNNAILLGIGLVDNTAKDLARISKNLRANGRNLSSIGSELTQGITFPVIAAGGALIKFAGDLDAMKKALAANMGGMAQANAEFEKLKELAKAPGIGLEEAIKGSYRLQGLGESADEARRQMANFAKVVSLSGGGEAQFGGLLQQFTQMKGVGKILGGDIRFMIENAPVLGKVLQDAFGTANPEKLRDMGITVDQLIEGMMREMDKLQGIGGSVKNTLENLWTSIRVGGGEIGLAVLSATGFGDTLEELSGTIDRNASAAAKWIRENKGVVKSIAEILVVMAATGPIARFVGNLGMIASFAAGAASKIAMMGKAIADATYAAYGVKGMTTLFAGLAVAVTAAHTELSKIANKSLWDEMQKNANLGLDNTLLRITAFVEGIKQLLFTFNFKGAFKNLDLAINGVNPMGAFNVPKNPYDGLGNKKIRSFGIKPPKIINPGFDDSAAQKSFEARVKLQREMEQMFRESPVKSRLDQHDPLQSGLAELSSKKIKPILPPIEQSDTKILKEYAAALSEISIEEKLGVDVLDLKKMKVDAAATAYREMAKTYGESSDQAVAALATWKSATEEQTEAQKNQNAELEKTNKILEYGKALTDGVSEAVSGLVSQGGGFEELSRGILKAALAMMKLAVADYVAKTISTLGFVGAIPAIVGGGALIGGMDALMNSISLAEGGMLTGESMVRAGEYQGVSVDPEVISPVSKIQKYIREAVGGGGVSESIIWGDHILVTANKAQVKAQRRASGNVLTF
jgi:tape measure domain-containing protein